MLENGTLVRSRLSFPSFVLGIGRWCCDWEAAWLHFCRAAPGKFQSNLIIASTNNATLRLCHILRYGILCKLKMRVIKYQYICSIIDYSATPLIAKFMGPMLAPWTLLSGIVVAEQWLTHIRHRPNLHEIHVVSLHVSKMNTHYGSSD